jgi:uncharacterized damage-inducible protein DinB
MKTALCFTLVSTIAFAQAPPAVPKTPPAMPTSAAQVLDRALSGLERQLVPLVEAMPADKFEYVPAGGEFKGVKTFAQHAKHLGAVNFLLGAGIAGEKSVVDMKDEENGPDAIKSKDEIVKFLKDSFVVAHKAFAGMKDAELIAPVQSPFGSNKTTRLNLALIVTSHGMDHYGQMVVYLRHNGIIPPASRR